MRKLTKAQIEALKWLRDRGGDGIFDDDGVLLAAGESAPHTRSTWNKLNAAGIVEFYGGRNGRSRVRIVTAGGRS